MKNGTIQVICGSGRGKTNAAVGRAIRALAEQKNVIMIQFLKGSQDEGMKDVLARLEPALKVFRFEKAAAFYEALSSQEKAEECVNIRNGLNFARKVMATGECDLLILDEVLGLVDNQIITIEELKTLLEARNEETDVILTGILLNDEICMLADEVTRVESLKYKRW